MQVLPDRSTPVGKAMLSVAHIRVSLAPRIGRLPLLPRITLGTVRMACTSSFLQ
jgi:hypothetical protein